MFFSSKRKQSKFSRAAAQAVRPTIEALDGRRLMSANFAGGTYIQNFDSLSGTGWSNDSTLPGWSLFNKNLSAITAVMVGSPTGNTGSFYAFGAADKALGGVGSGGAYFGSPATNSVAGWMALSLTNTSGNAISTFSFKYDGEQWRNGGNTSAQTMNVQYGFGATFASVATWTSTSANFTSPTVGASAGALDGNAAANRTANISADISANWGAGQTLWIRFVENNDSGNDHGLGLDNFSLTAGTPTGPGALAIDPGSKIVNEGDGTVSFNVVRIGGTAGQVSADLLLPAGFSDDFGPPSATNFIFADGNSTAQTVTFPILENSKYELNKSFAIGLTNPQGTAGAPTILSPSTLTLNDNDNPFFKESFESAPGSTYNLIGATGDNQRAATNSDGTPTTIYSWFNRFASPDLAAVGRRDLTGGFDGSFAIQGQNHTELAWGEGANPVRTISVPNIDISNRTELTTFLSLGAQNAEPAFEDWTSVDGISIYATIDGGEKVLVGQFKTSDDAGDLRLDTDLDGFGDGPILTLGALQNYAFNIPGTGDSLQLDIEVRSTRSFQAWAVDNVRVDGVFNDTTPILPAWVAEGSDATWSQETGTLTVNGPTTIISDTQGDAPLIVANGAAAVLTIAPTNGDKVIHLGSLSLTNGATASVSSVGATRSATNHLMVVVSGIDLTITGTSVLNLHDNDMVVQDTANAALIANLIASGNLKSDADNFTTALGYAANDGSAFYQFTNFGPTQEAVDANSVVVKFTAAGDANLDGTVNADDYFFLDFNFGNNVNALWSSGDLNGDGITNADDYFFTDFNFGASGF